MVEGCETLKPLAVFDLDGTLLRGNSLHEYIKAALSIAFRRRNYGRTLRIGLYPTLRVLRVVSHNTMKRHVLHAIVPGEDLRREFVARIDRIRNGDLWELLEVKRREGYAILLATAAPEIYIPWIWEGEYVCTDNAVTDDCRGDRKLEKVFEYARSHGMELKFAAADGSDDLPLINAAQEKLHL